MRTSFDRDAARLAGEHQSRKDSLEDERAAAGSPDGEAIFARADFTWRKRQASRAQCCAFDLRAANFRRSEYRRQMLAQQAGPLAPGANLFDPESLTSGER